MRWHLALVVALAACRPPDPPPPVPPPCSFSPLAVDFGEVDSLGLGESRQLRVRNDSPTSRLIVVTPPALPFSVASAPHFSFMPPNQSAVIEVSFAPDDGRLHLGELVITEDASTAVDGRCDLVVPLQGLGRGRISVAPRTLDVRLEPGEVVSRDLLINNSRRLPMELSARVQIGQSATGGAPIVTVDTTPKVVPPLGSLVLPISVAPRAADVVTGNVTITSGDGLTQHAPFRVIAGRPVAEVVPTEVSSWRVQYVAGSQPASYSRRRLTVRNVGSSGSVNELALRLGQPGFSLEPIQGGADELLVTGGSPDGLISGASTELTLYLMPRSLGPKEFRLRLFVDEPLDHPEDPLDPPDPVIEVMVRANVETMPACTMRVEPARVTLEPANGQLEGNVSFANLGVTPCIVDELRLTSSLPGFFILAGGADQVEVAPATSHVVTIAGPAQPFARPAGALEFHIFNEHGVTERVELFAP